MVAGTTNGKVPATLRSLEAIVGLCSFASYGCWLAVLVFAFDRGGAREAGIVAAAVLVPAIVLGPAGPLLAARRRPHRILGYTCAGLFVAHVGTAWAMFAGRAWAAYAGEAVIAALLTVPRPVAHALLPRLARSAQDVVAASGAVTTVDQLGRFVGPLAGGLMLSRWSPGAVFVAGAVATALATAACATLATAGHDAVDDGTDDGTDEGERRGANLDARRVLVTSASVRWVVGVMTLGSVAAGVVDVLSVTFAHERANGGSGSAGWLLAGFGLGAFLGAVASVPLLGGRRMVVPLLATGVAMGAPFVVFVAPIGLAVAFVLTVVAGAGAALSWLVGLVTLQRHQSSASLSAVLGVVEAVGLAGLALGSFAFAQLLSATSFTVALATSGAVVVGATALATLRLAPSRVLDEPPPAAVFHRLADDEVFASLPLPALERLARSAEELHVTEGHVLTRQGEPGDRYYVLVAGSVDVHVNGVAHERMTAGMSFGEVAVLHDIPRLATVTALDDVRVLCIGRDAFLEAIGVSPTGRSRAHAIAEGYLRSHADSAGGVVPAEIDGR